MKIFCNEGSWGPKNTNFALLKAHEDSRLGGYKLYGALRKRQLRRTVWASLIWKFGSRLTPPLSPMIPLHQSRPGKKPLGLGSYKRRAGLTPGRTCYRTPEEHQKSTPEEHQRRNARRTPEARRTQKNPEGQKNTSPAVPRRACRPVRSRL